DESSHATLDVHPFPTRRSSDLTYRFYTLATDKAGNAESAPASADSGTLLDTAKPSSAASSPALSSSTTIQVDYSASDPSPSSDRSEEHTSELQSRVDLVCRLLL